MFSKTASVHTALIAGLALSLACASGSTSPSMEAPETAKQAPGEQSAEPRPGATSSPAWTPVYFDTDSSLLRPDARQALQERARAIEANPDWGSVVVEGHCDQRGSEEYNLALGERRAGVVARYLMDLGVPAERLETRTYGEARPAVQGNTESAWQKNRRAELEPALRKSARSSTR